DRGANLGIDRIVAARIGTGRVTSTVGGCYRGRDLAIGGQDGTRNRHRPGAIGTHLGLVAVFAYGDGDRITFLNITTHRTSHGHIRTGLSRVDDVIASNRINADRRADFGIDRVITAGVGGR